MLRRLLQRAALRRATGTSTANKTSSPLGNSLASVTTGCDADEGQEPPAKVAKLGPADTLSSAGTGVEPINAEHPRCALAQQQHQVIGQQKRYVQTSAANIPSSLLEDGVKKKKKQNKNAAGASNGSSSAAATYDGVVIVGLGNPDSKYHRTRHNLGFLVIDAFCSRHHISLSKTKGVKGMCASGQFNNRPFFLLQPSTYMNLSGDAVSQYLRVVRGKAGNARVSSSNVLVVVDEKDLPYGQMRLKLSGSAAGHNGLKHIEQKLGSRDYHRLRVGIGRPPPGTPMASFVLEQFNPAEKAALQQYLDNAVDALEFYLDQPNADKAMTYINPKSSRFQLDVDVTP